MTQLEIFRKRQDRLKEDIGALLDSFLIGTVAKSPSMTGHNLTTKMDGKTVTRYVRKDVAPVALEMSLRYKKLWLLLQNLSKINWEIMNLENQ